MRLIHARHVAWRRIGEEFVVLDLAEKVMLGFNSSAGQIWSMLNKPREIHPLTSLEDTSLRHKVIRFIDELIERGLLVETDDDAVHCEWPRLADEPTISWYETMQQVAASCAFISTQSPVCDQAPFS